MNDTNDTNDTHRANKKKGKRKKRRRGVSVSLSLSVGLSVCLAHIHSLLPSFLFIHCIHASSCIPFLSSLHLLLSSHPSLLPTGWSTLPSTFPRIHAAPYRAKVQPLPCGTNISFSFFPLFLSQCLLLSSPLIIIPPSPCHLAVGHLMILPAEILLNVASFLSRPDLITSVRVCKQWNETLTPCIYLFLILHPSSHGMRADSLSNKHHSPSAYALRRFGRYARTLTLSLPCEIIDDLALYVRQLESLHIQTAYSACPDTVDTLAENLQFLLYNNDIQELHFDVIPSQDRFDLLSYCIVEHDAFKVINAELRGIAKYFSDRSLFLPGIKQLHLNVCCEPGLRVMVDWLSICPQLEEFYISRIRDEPLEQNLDIISDLKGLCPSLRRIEICGFYLDRNELPKVIECFPGLTDIHINGSCLGEAFFRALEPRLSDLTSLELYDCTSVRDWMSSLILFSCPHLVRFVSPIVSTTFCPRPPRPFQSVVLESGPRRFWACTGLKRLEAGLLMWSHDLEWNARAMEQLVALKDLEILTIGRPYYEPDMQLFRGRAAITESSGPWMPWSQGQFTRAELKKHDTLRWMVDAWPKLQHFWFRYPSEQQLPR